MQDQQDLTLEQRIENVNAVAVTPEQVEAADSKIKVKKGKLKQAKEEIAPPPPPPFILFEADPTVETVMLSELLPLDATPIPDAEYAMREINKKHLDRMYIAIQDGKVMPPLDVVHTSLGHVTLDGYHRWANYERYLRDTIEENSGEPLDASDVDKIMVEARKTFPVPVREVTVHSDHEMLDLAFKANLSHGLASGDASRTRYALWILAIDRSRPNRIEKEDISVREAARRADVSHVMVLKAMKRIAESKAKQAKKMIDLMKDDEAVEAVEITEEEKPDDYEIAERHMTAIVKAAKYFSDAEFTSTEMQGWAVDYVHKHKLTKEDMELVQRTLTYFTNAAPHATVSPEALIPEAAHQPLN